MHSTPFQQGFPPISVSSGPITNHEVECLAGPLALCCGLTLQVPKLPSQERLRLWQEAPTFVSCGSSKGQAEEAARLLLSRLVGEDGSTPQATEVERSQVQWL